MKLNIKNNENKDIRLAKIRFMKFLRIRIKEKYNNYEMKFNFDDEKDNSFKICYLIPPQIINNEEIEFLDDEFENKMKKTQKYEIRVELIEGNTNLSVAKKLINIIWFLKEFQLIKSILMNNW